MKKTKPAIGTMTPLEKEEGFFEEGTSELKPEGEVSHEGGLLVVQGGIQGRKDDKCSLPEEGISFGHWRRPRISQHVQETCVLLLLFECLFNFKESHFIDKV